mgnify:CR=1 FL=1
MKTHYKKIIVAFSVAIFLTGTIYIIVNLYKDSHKIIATEYFNEYFNVTTFKNGKVALLNKQTGKISSSKVDGILQPVEDSFSIFKSNKKYGYLNNQTGLIAINASFNKAWDFDAQSGLAAVVVNDKIGFIDHSGNYVITPQYKFKEPSLRDDIIFSGGFCIIPGDNGKIGVINTKNQIVLPAIYNNIKETTYGYKIIHINGKYGLADSLYRIVINPEYDNITLNHLGIIITDYLADKQYMLAYDYKTVITGYVFDDIEKIVIDYGYYDEESEIEHISYELSGYSKFTIKEKCGVIDDKTGKIIIPAKWDDIKYHEEGVFRSELDGSYFLININGKIIN